MATVWFTEQQEINRSQATPCWHVKLHSIFMDRVAVWFAPVFAAHNTEGTSEVGKPKMVMLFQPCTQFISPIDNHRLIVLLFFVSFRTIRNGITATPRPNGNFIFVEWISLIIPQLIQNMDSKQKKNLITNKNWKKTGSLPSFNGTREKCELFCVLAESEAWLKKIEINLIISRITASGFQSVRLSDDISLVSINRTAQRSTIGGGWQNVLDWKTQND